jgi:hypothetical protein
MADYSTSQTERVMLREQWEKWIREFSDWQFFVTLTFREIVTRDQAEHLFRFLVQVMNQELYGNHYMRIVGHSYFSYVAGFEHQKRGALHMHILVDQKIHFELVHSIWQKVAGYAWIEPVNDLARAVSYVSKYVVKDGDLTVWKQRKFKEPSFQPMWFQNRF